MLVLFRAFAVVLCVHVVFKQVCAAEEAVAHEADVRFGGHVWVSRRWRWMQTEILTVDGMALDVVATGVGLFAAGVGAVVAGFGLHGAGGKRCEMEMAGFRWSSTQALYRVSSGEMDRDFFVCHIYSTCGREERAKLRYRYLVSYWGDTSGLAPPPPPAGVPAYSSS